MDFLLWIISWFEFPIFALVFFIGVPASIIFIIVMFSHVYRQEKKDDYEEFKSVKNYREQFKDSVNRRRKNNE